MAETIAENALDLAQGTSSGGSSFWMRAPDNVDTKALAQALRERGVLIEPGAVFFGAGDARRQFYRLGYSSIDAAEIPEGVAHVAREIKKQAA